MSPGRSTVMVTVIHGESPDDPGVDLVMFGSVDLPSVYHSEDVWAWMENAGLHEDTPSVWASIVPADEAGGRSTGQIAAREVTITPAEMERVRAELAEQHDD